LAEQEFVVTVARKCPEKALRVALCESNHESGRGYARCPLPAFTRQLAFRTLLGAAAVVIVVAGLRAAAELLVPLCLAVFLAVLAHGPLRWLQRRRVPRWGAVVLVLFGATAGLGAFVGLLGTAVSGFQEALPRYEARLQELGDALHAEAAPWGLDPAQIYGALEPSSIMSVVGTTLGGIVGALVDASLVVLTMVFLLLEAEQLPAKLRLVAQGPRATLGPWLARMMEEIQRYLFIKTAVSAVTGLVVGLFLWVLGVDFPLLWGLTAFLLNYVPNIGSILASIPAVLVALVQLGPGLAALVATGYLVVNTVIGNVLEPQWMGRRLGLSPLVVFLALVFWGWVWGSLGMLLSVPITMACKLALEQSEDFRTLAILLGDAPREAAPGPAPASPPHAPAPPQDGSPQG
jgi:predicted PurR-regulated permease PerM